MTRAETGSIIRQIESLFDGGSIAGLSDGQLLERFNTRRESSRESAFAALVTRHGPMVLRVCRQILGDRDHAEDAFQAVFLVLARKADSLRDPDLLGAWLYGVAIRTARKANARLARVRRIEESDSMNGPSLDSSVLVASTDRSAEDSAIAREEALALHDEIDRLPKSFRLPVVLCYFEDLTLDEAARRLRWPAGTVRSRLARAREKLRRGLNRRGVVLPGGAMVAILSPRSTGACVGSALCDATTEAAIRFAAGEAVAPSVAILAQDVLKSMLANKLAITALSVLLVGAFASGAVHWNHSLATREVVVITPIEQQSPSPDKPDFPAPASGRMTMTGSVLDPAGKPLAGVPVELVGRRRGPAVARNEWRAPYALLGRGKTGADGRFRFDAARTSRVGFLQVQAVAAAPGFGLAWAGPNPDADEPTGEIRFRAEVPIRGKLIDWNGAPAAGVELIVRSLTRHDKSRGDDWMGAFPGEEIHNWPCAVKTGGDGRFTLTGIGRDMTVYIDIRDQRFAGQTIQVRTTDPESLKDVRYVLQPSTIVEGRALAADTGAPIPHASVSVGSSINRFWGGGGRRFPADQAGRFTANVAPGQYFSIWAYPPEGLPYLIPDHRFEWNKGAVKTAMDIKLPRGVLLRGKVVEEGTRRPLEGASVQFFANPRNDDILYGWRAIVDSKSDGSFQITVPPGQGHLLVFGPTPDYVLEEIGHAELWYGRRGGDRHYAHDIIAYNVKIDDSSHELVAELRPGKTVRGRVVAPDGTPVESAAVISRLEVEDAHPTARNAPTIFARDGRFELHGLDPAQAVPVIFFDPIHEWGATVELSGKRSGDDLLVQLKPNGRARARFVGPDGRPIAGFQLGFNFELIITPGPPRNSRRKEDRGKLAADAGDMVNMDQRHYLNFPPADSDGRVVLPNLVPGAVYRILDSSTTDVPDKGVQARRDFSVKPGEELALGDVLIEEPHG
jgi:RNA polymerase sigma factor (sigma-70 family)